MTETTHLALPLLAAGQAQKHVTHNEALLAIDALLQCAVLARDLGAPPDAPGEGARFLVAAPATGAWSGQAGRIAVWQDGLWHFHAPQPGFTAFVVDESLIVLFDGAAWTPLAAALGPLQNLSRLGIGTAADAGHPFSAKLNAALWTAKPVGEGGTGDLRATWNKETASGVLSLLLQTGYAARAEIGLVGDDEFVVRTSPDGSVFDTGLRAHRDLHGRVAVKEAWRRTWAAWAPRLGTAALDAFGLAPVETGTAAATVPTGVSFHAQSPRIRYVSAAIPGSSAGLNGAGLGWWRGTSGAGGFYVVLRAGLDVAPAGVRFFMGLRGATSPTGDVEPSALSDIIGIGTQSGQTTLRVLARDGTGPLTAIDLGPGFPVGSHELYELILSAEPGAASLRYRIERLNAGNVASGTIAAGLPAATTFLTPHVWANNGPSASPVELGFVGLHIESACLTGSRGSLS